MPRPGVVPGTQGACLLVLLSFLSLLWLLGFVLCSSHPPSPHQPLLGSVSEQMRHPEPRPSLLPDFELCDACSPPQPCSHPRSNPLGLEAGSLPADPLPYLGAWLPSFLVRLRPRRSPRKRPGNQGFADNSAQGPLSRGPHLGEGKALRMRHHAPGLWAPERSRAGWCEGFIILK